MSEYGPQFDAFATRVRRELVPKLKSSHVVVTITPQNKEELDVKFAVELGLAIMLDKPIVAAIRPGTHIPEKLARVVERFVELGDLTNPSEGDRLAAAITEAIAAAKQGVSRDG